MRGLRGRAHDATGKPLAGLLGHARADCGKPCRETRRAPMARRGQPPASAVLVAWLRATTPRSGSPRLTQRSGGAGGHRGHALDAISSPGTFEVRYPPHLCGDNSITDVIACLHGGRHGQRRPGEGRIVPIRGHQRPGRPQGHELGRAGGDDPRHRRQELGDPGLPAQLRLPLGGAALAHATRGPAARWRSSSRGYAAIGGPRGRWTPKPKPP